MKESQLVTALSDLSLDDLNAILNKIPEAIAQKKQQRSAYEKRKRERDLRLAKYNTGPQFNGSEIKVQAEKDALNDQIKLASSSGQVKVIHQPKISNDVEEMAKAAGLDLSALFK